MPKNEIVDTLMGAGKMGLSLACQFAMRGNSLALRHRLPGHIASGCR
jgi:hypothetical protein